MKHEKNDISYILAVFLTVNSVENLSVLKSFRLVVVYFHSPIILLSQLVIRQNIWRMMFIVRHS